MARGRQASDWKHTSALLAMLFNAHTSGPPRSPASFDPTLEVDKRHALHALRALVKP